MSHQAAEGQDHSGLYPTSSSLSLHQAVIDGDSDAVKRLINSGEVVNAYDASGNLPLHLSILLGRKDIITLLLAPDKRMLDQPRTRSLGQTSVDPFNAPPPSYEKVLSADLKRDHSETLANPNAVDHSGRTALALATLHGDLEAVERLLGAGADPNLGRGKCSLPLHIAAERPGLHYVMIIKHLLEHDASPLYVDNQQRTPFLVACEKGNTEGARTLLTIYSRYGGPNLYRPRDMVGENHPIYGTVLHCAGRSGNKSLIDFLISNGARIDQNDSRKIPAVFEAIVAMNFHCVPCLLKTHKYDPDGYDFLTQSLLQMEVTDEYLVKTFKALRVYLPKFVRSCYKPLFTTPLCKMVEASNLKLTEMLLDSGAVVNPPNTLGDPHLLAAVMIYLKKNVAIGMMFRANTWQSEDVSANSRDTNEAMIRLLLNYGADVNAVTSLGLTALHLCAEWKDEVVGKLLLYAGAQPQSCQLCPDHKATPGSYCPTRTERETMWHCRSMPHCPAKCSDFMTHLRKGNLLPLQALCRIHLRNHMFDLLDPEDNKPVTSIVMKLPIPERLRHFLA